MKNGQYIEAGNIVYTRRRQTNQKYNTICVGHQIRHEPSNKICC